MASGLGIQWLDSKTRAAPTGCHRIRIANLKGLPDQIVYKIDFGTTHKFKAHGIDQHRSVALLQNDIVAGRLFLYEIIFVLKSRTAAPRHRDPQHSALGLLGQNARNAFCSPIGQDDV